MLNQILLNLGRAGEKRSHIGKTLDLQISHEFRNRNLKVFLNAQNIALNPKVIVIIGGKVGKSLENWENQKYFHCGYSNCAKLNPDHEYIMTFLIGYRKSRETPKNLENPVSQFCS